MQADLYIGNRNEGLRIPYYSPPRVCPRVILNGAAQVLEAGTGGRHFNKHIFGHGAALIRKVTQENHTDPGSVNQTILAPFRGN